MGVNAIKFLGKQNGICGFVMYLHFPFVNS